jgi:hypothetical protein
VKQVLQADGFENELLWLYDKEVTQAAVAREICKG